MNNWKVEWVNPQFEPTYKSYTLILSKNSGESFRIDKVFPNMELSEEFLQKIAEKEIKILEAELASQ
jgi:hypothetical protein